VVSINYIKAHYLDASAAVKLVIEELGSDHLRGYFEKHSGFYITSFCLFEALNVLKRKMRAKDFTFEQYLDKCWLLLAYLRGKPKCIHIDDPGIDGLETFQRAEELAKRHRLDLSDALQLLTVKYGKFCKMVEESKTLLITADGSLAKAAKAERLRVWNPAKEPAPQTATRSC
jgi:predicted nucleic acid-binding protein